MGTPECPVGSNGEESGVEGVAGPASLGVVIAHLEAKAAGIGDGLHDDGGGVRVPPGHPAARFAQVPDARAVVDLHPQRVALQRGPHRVRGMLQRVGVFDVRLQRAKALGPDGLRQFSVDVRGVAAQVFDQLRLAVFFAHIVKSR